MKHPASTWNGIACILIGFWIGHGIGSAFLKSHTSVEGCALTAGLALAVAALRWSIGKKFDN